MNIKFATIVLLLTISFNLSLQNDVNMLIQKGYETKNLHFGGKSYFKKTDTGSDSQVFLPAKNEINYPRLFKNIMDFKQNPQTSSSIIQCNMGSGSEFFKFLAQTVAVLGKNRQETIQISSPCFKKTTFTYTRIDTITAQIEIEAQEPSSMLCSDIYLFGTPDNFHMETIFFKGKHTITLNKLSHQQFESIENFGLHVFVICDSIAHILPDILMTAGLFLGGLSTNPNLPFVGSHPTWYMEYLNPLFIKHATGFQWQKRSNPKFIDLDEKYVNSGDFLAITRMDGVDQIIQWGTGSHSGHSAVALRIDGELYVVESQDGWYWPKHGIQKNKWKDWLKNANNAGFNVALLPLSKEMRAKFNETRAVEFFKELEFTPYGYHNFLFSWIDTVSGNLPAILDIDFVTLAFVVLEKVSPATVTQFIGEAVNKRLNTTGLSFHDAVNYAQTQKKSVAELFAMVEEQGWDYSDGKSYVCSCFVAGVWKAGGLFDDLQVHATEFTPKDIYQLKFYDSEYVKPEPCQGIDNDLPYCQLMGKFKMELPGYNTIAPYEHMNERCPSQAPDYFRPDGC